MWKLIDDDFISKLKVGQIISDNASRHGSYQVKEVRDNGLVTAVKTDIQHFVIIFPREDLVDASWWVNEQASTS